MEMLFVAGIWIIMIGFWIAYLVLLIIALIDIVKNEFKNPNDKLIYVIIVVFVPIVGPIIYFVVGRKQKILKS